MRVHPLNRLPDPWRKIVDSLFTIAVAITFVLVFEAEVAKPYRIPSASMERTLECARTGPECVGATSDRVLVNRLAYDFSSPQRGQIVVFKAPVRASGCAAGDGGSTFVKRLIGLPGETVRSSPTGRRTESRTTRAAGRRSDQIRSITAAIAWPKPMHIVARP